MDEAEPRRRNHTIGSKRLRRGGSFPAPEMVMVNTEMVDKSRSMLGAEGGRRGEKSGIMTESSDSGKQATEGENQGEITASNLVSGYSRGKDSLNERRENNITNIEASGLVILDSKRRRTDQVDIQGPTDEEMLDSQKITKSDQKNLLEAGSGFQARLSS